MRQAKPRSNARPSSASASPSRPLVGVIVNTGDTYGRAILRGVTRYANLQRRWLLFKDVERVQDTNKEWPRFDGAIFAGVPGMIFEYGLKRCGHGVYCSGGGDPTVCPVVGLDDRAAGAQAAAHLLECRLQNFGFYGFQADYKTVRNRLAGFEAKVAEHGFKCDVCPVERATIQQLMSHEHRPRLIQWLRGLPKPAGVMTMDDTSAHDLAEACLEAGIAVPDHVAIIGVNNDDLLCESAWPPLSSVEADFTRMGYLAARILERLLAGEVLSPEERLTLLPPLGVVQRQSTSILAIDDPNLVDALRFIREHACDPCTVGDVLQHVPVNRRWLERQFIIHFNRSPHDEIIRVRIETAQRLLQRSDLNIMEIAGKCGFAS